MSGVRLLVVDDDDLQVELVERALTHDGFEVRGARSMDELARVAAAFDPELILLDVNMPDAPNDRTLAIARAACPAAGVVLYSAWEESKLRKLAAELGADGFISKSESVFGIAAKLRTFKR
ncbi:MAG: response regulator [Deltaproteobacteria bacterium]|nr:response regulator [Deltaproteobacteria bacterium]MCW5801421.1 response regulator [Deltaproteobacteria bacterium]